MWMAKSHQPHRPWRLLSSESAPPYFGGLPNYASGADLEDQAKQFQAELVEQIYWQGKPAPRQSTRGRPESMASLYSDQVKRHVSFEVRELADRLHVSERHVRRKLAALVKAGKIPTSWRVGKQWRPPVEQAERAILVADSKTHRPHTHAAADTYADCLIQCRRDADKLQRELEEAGGKLEICRTWIRLVCTKPPVQMSHDEAEVFYDKARERGFAFICQLAEKRRWSFCKLFVGIYTALLNGSATPVADTINFLGLNHAIFYRIYTKKEIREAQLMARRIQTQTDWLGYASQTGQRPDDVSAAFADWEGMVSPEALWVDTH